ncbi:hypothetical protein BTW14_gp196 [BeAn 58058 virus]|uniref:hypothetical protein n=1 Tax=BeAn 58058 virus TaxID=67082 RepID=UPI00090AB3F3|nr:hypothetical protein BTW14_gp196 [BeAn 58058 virus]APG58387.1 hypothetical protein BAV00214 [BeAn 58058 virus]
MNITQIFIPVYFSLYNILEYYYTGILDNNGDVRFIYSAYLNNEEFIRYDSLSDDPRPEPRTSWAKKIKFTQILDEYNKIKYMERTFKMNLRILSKGDKSANNKLQLISKCTIYPRSTSWSNVYVFNERIYSHISSYENTWIDEVKTNLIKLDDYKNYNCFVDLNRYINKKIPRKVIKPIVCVEAVKYGNHDDLLALNCYARGFFPKDILITWMDDENNDHIQDCLMTFGPNGDGTYRIRAEKVVSIGEENKFSCEVYHEPHGYIVANITDPNFNCKNVYAHYKYQ